MTYRPHPSNQGIFSLALASRGLAPTRISYEPTEAEISPRPPSVLHRLSMLAAAAFAVLGVVTLPPGA